MRHQDLNQNLNSSGLIEEKENIPASLTLSTSSSLFSRDKQTELAFFDDVTELVKCAKAAYMSPSEKDTYLDALGFKIFKTGSANETLMYKKDFSYWVFAMRGTVLTDLKNIIDDINIALDSVPPSIGLIMNHYLDTEKEINKMDKPDASPEEKNIVRSFKETTMRIVGHSLGAVQAACMHAALYSMRGERSLCLTVDNPGSYDIVYNYLKIYLKMEESAITAYMTRLEVWNIQSLPNLINTSNRQLGPGLTFWRYNLTSSVIVPHYDVASSYKENFFYIYSHTVDQHSIENILHAVEENRYMGGIPRTNGSFQDGYLCYLQLDSTYWRDYFDYCWKTSDADELQPKYIKQHKTEDNFLSDMYSMLYKIIHPTSFLVKNSVFNNKDPEDEIVEGDFVLVNAPETSMAPH